MILKSDLTELQADLTELRGRFDNNRLCKNDALVTHFR